MGNLDDLKKELRKFSSPQKAKASAWFFKTGEGEYGYGDKFLGVTVPEQRTIAKKFANLSLDELESLLASKYHEERLTALIILVMKFQKADVVEREKIFNFYLKNTKNINNWDLVDTSAHKIVGEFLVNKNRGVLFELVKSNSLWERRISIIATMAFLKQKEFKTTFEIADILISDRNDLIQKAVGWTLREVGKWVSEEELEVYLQKNYKKMGRTALRYAIERMPEGKRRRFLLGKI